MKKIFPTLCLTLLLVGCVDNSPLRSDIEEFVASFSLEEAMLTYTDMGYQKTVTTNKEEVTVVVESMDIRSTDMECFSYDFTKVTKVDGVTQKEEYSRIETIDKHFYLTTDQNPEKYENRALNHYQDLHAVSVYLAFEYPEKYCKCNGYRTNESKGIAPLLLCTKEVKRHYHLK